MQIPTQQQILPDEKDDNKNFHFVYVMVKSEDAQPPPSNEGEEEAKQE